MAKEYTLIGGNGTVVSPLEVTEDGDYFAGDSRAFNPVKVRASGSGSSTLSGLTDVDISNPSNGQTLVYNSTSGKWENGAGGGVMILQGSVGDDPESIQLAITYAELYTMLQNGPVVVNCPGYTEFDIYNVLLTGAAMSEGMYLVVGLLLMSTINGRGAATDTVLLTLPN